MDILFIIDCTFSMDPYIDKAKETILSIISNARRTFINYKFRVGVVAYRDFD